jgi:hypothetical protein
MKNVHQITNAATAALSARGARARRRGAVMSTKKTPANAYAHLMRSHLDQAEQRIGTMCALFAATDGDRARRALGQGDGASPDDRREAFNVAVASAFAALKAIRNATHLSEGDDPFDCAALAVVEVQQ